jgi:uncharacterized membrane-anchored protein
MPSTELLPFLQWLVYAGGSILIGSWILEHIPAFINLQPDIKKLIAIVVNVALSLGFYAVMVYVPADIMVQLAPWFTVAAGTIVLYSGGQVVHKLTKLG